MAGFLSYLIHKMKKYGYTIIVISVVCGLFITVSDYWVQMTTVETNYFVSKLLSLNGTNIQEDNASFS